MARRTGVLKRVAEVPKLVRLATHHASRSDLLEAAYYLASLCNDAGSCDDVQSTVARLVNELNTLRAAQGRPKLRAFKPRNPRALLDMLP